MSNNLATTDRIILGIDPGTVVMGYGLVHIKGNLLHFLHCDIIRLSNNENHALRLKIIFEQISRIIEEHQPDELAIEAPFFGKNVQSMLKLGRAQGVAIAAALNKNIPVFEYSPKKIKQSITGNGNAAKEQVAAMLQSLLQVDALHDYLDATDALGAAVCHYFQSKPGRSGTGKQSYSGWKAFLADNPGRKA